MEIAVEPLGYSIGARVMGVDASKPLSENALKIVRDAWLRHLVLVFPDQQIDMPQHIAFSRQFGELELHPLMHIRHREYPEIFEVTNKVTDGKPSETGEVGRKWHSDGAFTTTPPTGSLLHCREKPDVGGDTWFTSMYAAYEGLSDRLKGIVDTLEVVNDIKKASHIIETRNQKKVEEELVANPPVVQPMVRVHPETGRKALYLNETVTKQIHGMTAEESKGLLNYLYQHSVRPEFTYRHRWSLYDIVMWDNRSTMHLAPKDYDSSQIRRMCRTTLVGEPHGRVLG